MAEANNDTIQGVATISTRPTSNIIAHDIGSDTRPTKRRKTQLACNVCRDRKTRCDGHRPTCSSCAKKGLSGNCIYEEGSLKTQRYVSTLENRLKELEKSSQRGSDRSSSDYIDSGPTQDGRFDFVASPPDHHIETQKLRQRHLSPLSPNDFIGTDATVIVPSPGNDGDCSSGNTSTMALVQSVMRTTGMSNTTGNAPRLNFDCNVDPLLRSKQVPRGAEHSEGPDINAFALPTRRMADNFMRCFWDYTHPIFPILHKPTFITSYELLWSPDNGNSSGSVCGTAEDPIFLSTLNIVFAIACQFSDIVAPAKRTNLADQFYQQSRKLYNADALDFASLLTVQMLLLTGLYLQSTKYASRCWHMIGLAIRTAQDIGIHTENTRTSKKQLEREMRRRVWHNCVIFDRLLAIIFGRPNMISRNLSVPVPLMVDDEYLLEDGEGSQPSQSEPHIGFLVFSIKLFDILDHILSKIYHHDSVKPFSQGVENLWWSRERLEDVLKLNSSLDDLFETLPNNLKLMWSTDRGRDLRSDTAILQAKVFYSRFLYIRILLLRPVLLSAAQNRNNLSRATDDMKHLRLEEHLALNVCVLCVSTVYTLVSHLHENLDAVYRSSGWRTVHYSFVCAIVLLAARLCPIPNEEFNSASLQESVSRCIAIIEEHRLQIQSAAHAIKVLETLQHHVALVSEGGSNEAIRHQANEAVDLNNLSAGDYTSNLNLRNDLLQFDEPDTNLLSEAWFMEQIGNIDWLDVS